MRFATSYGHYELNNFPGCAAIVVSNHAFVHKQHRRLGLGNINHMQRLQHAQKLGYNYILCTVQSTNTIQLKILKKHKWKQLDTFINDETEHTIMLFGKTLGVINNTRRNHHVPTKKHR